MTPKHLRAPKIFFLVFFFVACGRLAQADEGHLYPDIVPDLCQSLAKSIAKMPMTQWGDDWPASFARDGLQFLPWKNVDPASSFDLIKENVFETQIQASKDAGQPYDTPAVKAWLSKLWRNIIQPKLINAIKINAIKAQIANIPAPKFGEHPLEIFRYGIDVKKYDKIYGGQNWAYQYFGPTYMWNYTIREETGPTSFSPYPIRSSSNQISGELAMKAGFLLLLTMSTASHANLFAVFPPGRDTEGGLSVFGICGFND